MPRIQLVQRGYQLNVLPFCLTPSLGAFLHFAEYRPENIQRGYENWSVAIIGLSTALTATPTCVIAGASRRSQTGDGLGFLQL